ncbi:MAG: hypothetical protein HYV32_06185 [Candidatus Kerfeldbacteria bacterium]|nr:hypothetical protein [Candidatus Kerfeldbacteria bacterium]
MADNSKEQKEPGKTAIVRKAVMLSMGVFFFSIILFIAIVVVAARFAGRNMH